MALATPAGCHTCRLLHLPVATPVGCHLPIDTYRLPIHCRPIAQQLLPLSSSHRARRFSGKFLVLPAKICRLRDFEWYVSPFMTLNDCSFLFFNMAVSIQARSLLSFLNTRHHESDAKQRLHCSRERTGKRTSGREEIDDRCCRRNRVATTWRRSICS